MRPVVDTSLSRRLAGVSARLLAFGEEEDPPRAHQVDPQLSRVQQQQYMAAQLNAGLRQQHGVGLPQGQYPWMDMFPYGMPPQQYSPVSTQFGAQAMSVFSTSMANSMCKYGH